MAFANSLVRICSRIVESLLIRQRVPHQWLHRCEHIAAAGEQDETFGRLKAGDEIWSFSNHYNNTIRNTRPNISGRSRLASKLVEPSDKPAKRCLHLKSGRALVRNGKVIRRHTLLVS